MALLTLAPAAISFLLAVSAPQVDAQPRKPTEHDVKAAFLYNFTRFVTWPDGTPPGSEPFRLCVVADEALTRSVVHTMLGETINGRPAETVSPKTPAEARACQVLFVGEAEAERTMPMLQEVRDLPVLTVGESRGFVESGGTIEFVVERDRVRFDVNLKSATRAGLTISSRLLRVARDAR